MSRRDPSLTDDRPLRVLQVGSGTDRGGIISWLLNVLRHTDRKRLQMDFLVHTDEEGVHDSELRELGCRVIPCLGHRRPWAYARRFLQIARECGPYDVCHSHPYLYSGFNLYLARRAGIATRIAHIYPHVDPARRGLTAPLYRRAMVTLLARCATVVLADSCASLAAFRRICDCARKHTEVIYCGIDLAPFRQPIDRQAARQRLGLPADMPVVTYVARFYPHKNHAQMVRIADRLGTLGVPAHFAAVGSHGPLLQSFQRLAEEREDFSVLSEVGRVSEVLLASDVFLFPSVNEGFGIVAVEAAAAGLPIVATDLPTIREACPPSHHRFMFGPNDDDAASLSLQEILSNADLRRTLGQEARDWATRFDVARSAARLEAVYAGAL
jgi:glycosyltransferase involved in cell wall biosynthesis